MIAWMVATWWHMLIWNLAAVASGAIIGWVSYSWAESSW